MSNLFQKCGLSTVKIILFILAISLILGCGTAVAPPPPTPSSFFYFVQVQAKGTGEAIDTAEVIISVGEKAPLDGITDSRGIARVRIPSDYVDEPGFLVVKAEEYGGYTQNIDLVEGALPDVILLERLAIAAVITPMLTPITPPPVASNKDTPISTPTNPPIPAVMASLPALPTSATSPQSAPTTETIVPGSATATPQQPIVTVAPTSTPTLTPMPTATHTPSPSPTSIFTPTATSTPTNTPTPTPEFNCDNISAPLDACPSNNYFKCGSDHYLAKPPNYSLALEDFEWEICTEGTAIENSNLYTWYLRSYITIPENEDFEKAIYACNKAIEFAVNNDQLAKAHYQCGDFYHRFEIEDIEEKWCNTAFHLGKSKELGQSFSESDIDILNRAIEICDTFQ